MQRTELAPGVTRVRLMPDDGQRFRPIVFSDGGGEYLRQTGFSSAPRPVYRLTDGGGGAVKQTANGEVVVFDSGQKRMLRVSHAATLRFACAKGSVLTGLGQHESGAFDCSDLTERLYQHNMKISIPFLLSSGGWGIWFENGCAMRYNGMGDGFTFELDAAEEVSYVVIRGENCAGVLRRFYDLVGRPALLPRWAYGYIQSKERYHSADELLDVAGEFRKRNLPLDCIVLDWMSWAEGFWGDKTPDPGRFPDVKAMTDALHGMGVRFMVSIWPNMAKGRDCDAFERAGLFLPDSRIYDAFSEEARALYWQQCRRHWMDGGADALWCDSCEPITDPDWCGEEKRDEDTRMALLTEAAGLRMDPERMLDYGAAHLRGLRDGWLRDYPGKRPVLLSRSGGADSSALGAILWSGDVAASWDTLRRQVAEGLRAACSGICWWTLDIGAFFVDTKDPWFWRGEYPAGVDDPAYRELYVRWFQFGATLPVFRSHGTDTPREPWRFGGEESAEYQALRSMLELRYRLLPYLYATAAQCCREGMPMLRAMLVAFPDAPELYPVADQYMLGDALLAKPVTRSLGDGGGLTTVELPEGGWYDLFTLAYHPGGQVDIPTPLGRLPLLVRAGGIVPVAEGARSASDVPAVPREVWVFGGADGRFDCYGDSGDGPMDGGTIPMRFDATEGTFTLGAADRTLGGPVEVNVRFVDRDGAQRTGTVEYDGHAVDIRLADAEPAPTRPFWEH